MNINSLSSSIICQDILNKLKERHKIWNELKPMRNIVRDKCLTLYRIDRSFKEIDKNKFFNFFKNFNIRFKGFYGTTDQICSLKEISDIQYNFQIVDEWTGAPTEKTYLDYLVSYTIFEINNLSNKEIKKCSLLEFLHLLDYEGAYLEERK